MTDILTKDHVMGLHDHNISIAFILSTSSVERIIYECYLVFNLWKEWKTFLPTDRKKRKKKLHSWVLYSKPQRFDENNIYDWLIDEKSFHPMGYWKEKPKNL